LIIYGFNFPYIVKQACITVMSNDVAMEGICGACTPGNERTLCNKVELCFWAEI